MSWWKSIGGGWPMWLGHLMFPERPHGSWALNLPQRPGDMGAIFLDDYIQRQALRSIRKVFLGYKTSKKWGEDLYLKETENELILFWIIVFSKLSVLEKRAYGQDKSGYSIIKLRVTVRLSWSTSYFKIHICSIF